MAPPEITPDPADVRKLSPLLGAEVSGIDLGAPLDDTTAGSLLDLFHEHGVVQFHHQDLGPADLLRIAACFGEIGEYPFAASMAGYPGVVEIIKEPHQTSNFGGIWHTDTAYLPEPPAATLLYAVETPPAGGDTLFASMAAVYDLLPQSTRSLLEGRQAHHSASLTAAAVRGDHLAGGSMQGSGADSEAHSAWHPVIRTHPNTGRRSVYLSPAHTTAIEGLDGSRTRQLLDQVYALATAGANVLRLSWRPGTLVIWDNRCTLHCAVNDYDGFRRRMQRVTVNRSHDRHG